MRRSDVFLTDGHWRKCLAAVRALGRERVRVTVGESTRLATAAFSNQCSRRVVYPSPLSRPHDFTAFLLKELTDRSYRMLVPMEDETLDIISRHYADFSKLTCVPIVPHDTFKLAQRKDKILKLAEKKGIPIPRTWFVDDVSQLEDIKSGLPYPVVIKPRTGSGAKGICYPEDPDDLVRQYMRVHRRFPFPLIQECIPRNGNGYGASFLFDRQGNVRASFVHKRLREYPVTGGASTLRESVRNDDVRDMAHTLLKALDWFGIAMVEFKVDPRDNIPKLMEINPRFWGSLALAVESGVNFPHLLYRMSCGENFKPVEHYRTGIKCRWLLHGDILHFIFNPDRGKLVPEFFRFLDSNTCYDILSVRDPLPALARMLIPLTFLYDPGMKFRLRQRNL